MLTTIAKQSQTAIFTRGELRAVSIATAMLVVLGTLVVAGMTVALGHYNSLLHCGPKAAVDALALALLLNAQPRWRCVALLGVVYAIVLLMQLGMPYVAGVIAVAGVVAAVVGAIVAPLGRSAAVTTAALVFVIGSGFTFPIRIILSADRLDEPIWWAMWLAEWPLRAAGAVAGILIARRFIRQPEVPSDTVSSNPARRMWSPGAPAVPVGVATGAMLAAATVPMLLDTWLTLAVAAMAGIVYGWFAGLRRALFTCLTAVLWGWVVFAAGSWVWHQDWTRALDLGRTFALRFTPMTIAAVVLLRSARPRETVRMFRRLYVPRAVLWVLATALREIQSARQVIYEKLHMLKQQTGRAWPVVLVFRPIATTRALTGPLIHAFAGSLRRTAAGPDATGCHRNGIVLADQEAI